MKRNFLDYLLLTLKGMLMGAADIVPGISGGTIALITGIYEELIYSLSNFNLSIIDSRISGSIILNDKSSNSLLTSFIPNLSAIGA